MAGRLDLPLVSDNLSPLSGEPVGVYRTTPARVIGWTMVLGAAVLAGLTILDTVRGREAGLLFPLALVVGVAVGAWVLFLRPHVRLYTDGVVLANVISDIAVPFAAIEDVTTQWALELHDHQGRRHSSWAVPVRRERFRRQQVESFAETTRQRGSGGMSAQGVADQVHRTWQRWKLDGGELEAREQASSPAQGAATGAAAGAATGGAAGATPQARPVQNLSWPAVIALGLAISLAIVAIFN